MDTLSKAIEILKNGGVVAVPTDTVYGLIANALDENAVLKIYRLKKRPLEKPLVLFVHDIDEAHRFAEFTPDSELLANEFWPGPLTLILKATSESPKALVTPDGTIGIRIPRDEVVMMLMRKLDFPIASTSANISGMPPAKTSQEVYDQLDDAVDFILVGTAGGTAPSTVIDMSVSPPVVLRKGALSFLEIEKRLKKEVKFSDRLTLNILFVCTGNLYRSQIAEALLKDKLTPKLAARVNVESAGLSAMRGAPIPQEVVMVLKEMGIRYGNMRSKPLTPDMLDRADIIYVMERRQLEKIREMGAGGKALLLSDDDIPDPVGRGYPFVKMVAHGINSIIDARILPYIIRKF